MLVICHSSFRWKEFTSTKTPSTKIEATTVKKNRYNCRHVNNSHNNNHSKQTLVLCARKNIRKRYAKSVVCHVLNSLFYSLVSFISDTLCFSWTVVWQKCRWNMTPSQWIFCFLPNVIYQKRKRKMPNKKKIGNHCRNAQCRLFV